MSDRRGTMYSRKVLQSGAMGMREGPSGNNKEAKKKSKTYILLPDHDDNRPPPRHHVRQISQPRTLRFRIRIAGTSTSFALAKATLQLHADSLNAVGIPAARFHPRELRFQIVERARNGGFVVAQVERVECVRRGRFGGIDGDGAFVVLFPSAFEVGGRGRKGSSGERDGRDESTGLEEPARAYREGCRISREERRDGVAGQGVGDSRPCHDYNALA